MSHIISVIAPYGSVTDVRDAGGDALGEGRKLESGGVAWDFVLDDNLRSELEDAGAEIYDREKGEFLSDVLEQAGYTPKELNYP